MVEASDIPEGVFAFSGDGMELGRVVDVGGSGLLLEDTKGSLHWIPLTSVLGVTAGKLVLRTAGQPWT
jgi:hypothetical protein